MHSRRNVLPKNIYLNGYYGGMRCKMGWSKVVAAIATSSLACILKTDGEVKRPWVSIPAKVRSAEHAGIAALKLCTLNITLQIINNYSWDTFTTITTTGTTTINCIFSIPLQAFYLSLKPPTPTNPSKISLIDLLLVGCTFSLKNALENVNLTLTDKSTSLMRTRGGYGLCLTVLLLYLYTTLICIQNALKPSPLLRAKPGRETCRNNNTTRT